MNWPKSTYVPVAQLDRALACGAKGRTFESYRAYHILNQNRPFGRFLLPYFINNCAPSANNLIALSAKSHCAEY